MTQSQDLLTLFVRTVILAFAHIGVYQQRCVNTLTADTKGSQMSRKKTGGKKRKRRSMSDPSGQTGDINREVGLKVRQRRQELGMSTTELGNQVGLSQAQISRLENGLQGLRSSVVVRLAEVLGVDPAYFFGGRETALRSGVVRESESSYGPSVPPGLAKALRSARFRKFITNCARVYMQDAPSFDKLSSFVRSTKLSEP